MGERSIEKRKADHIQVALGQDAGFREQETLLADVRLVHQSLPEMALDDVDLTTRCLGKSLSAPLFVSGMTGGTPEARRINQDLARAAQQVGIGFGVGSQRAMAEKPELASTYAVRDVAPDVLLLGNIGAVQASAYGPQRVATLAEAIGADALAVHLNPAQEMAQPGGDRDFSNILRTLESLTQTLAIPLVAKETGCGISRQAARSLYSAGVRWIDVSGAGGTSWVAVERHRSEAQSLERAVGDELWDWGIPTAVSVHICAQEGLHVLASGGIRTGLDIARAIALGATAAGMAAPVLRAHRDEGYDGVVRLLESLIHRIRVLCLLTGCRTSAQLANTPRHIAEPLASWIRDIG